MKTVATFVVDEKDNIMLSRISRCADSIYDLMSISDNEDILYDMYKYFDTQRLYMLIYILKNNFNSEEYIDIEKYDIQYFDQQRIINICKR